jgi:hypothetical protein
MLKYLRIAVTALCLTTCVLLVALWVRSYWWSDRFLIARSANRVLSINSNFGVISIGDGDRSKVIPQPPGWSNRPARSDWREKHNAHGFSFATRPGFSFVAFPIWLLVVMLLLVAGAPWIHRLSYQFSLRTLLIATALVAVGLGMVVYLSG